MAGTTYLKHLSPRSEGEFHLLQWIFTISQANTLSRPKTEDLARFLRVPHLIQVYWDMMIDYMFTQTSSEFGELSDSFIYISQLPSFIEFMNQQAQWQSHFLNVVDRHSHLFICCLATLVGNECSIFSEYVKLKMFSLGHYLWSVWGFQVRTRTLAISPI